MDRELIKVLLIEDNQGDVRLIQEMLKEEGASQFKLKHVDCLSSGLEQLAINNCDIILLDLGLPDSHGLSALSRILAQIPKVPIVVLTGLADEMLGVKAVQEGAQDYLTKGHLDGKLLVRSIRYAIERKRTEEELRKQRDHLEFLTNRLAAVNKELEAFSYSVSHDLRAPLQKISGFCEILKEDYADKLDEQGKKYLQRVIDSSRRMAQLVKDLLNLARITRSEMRCNAVDLSTLAKMIVKELHEMNPERQVEFLIADGLVANGDPHLLQVVLGNLLSNAWKYTGKCPRAKIEFGAILRGGKSVYFVRDNGIGFDMVYVNKLFTPFQRLHSATEYEGTGIGLAIVQRVIQRHGGHIWVESAVDRGTTFYFTL